MPDRQLIDEDQPQIHQVIATFYSIAIPHEFPKQLRNASALTLIDLGDHHRHRKRQPSGIRTEHVLQRPQAEGIHNHQKHVTNLCRKHSISGEAYQPHCKPRCNAAARESIRDESSPAAFCFMLWLKSCQLDLATLEKFMLFSLSCKSELLHVEQ